MMNPMKEIMASAQNYKQSKLRARYIVSFFKNDGIPMMIFSYLWPNDQAMRRVRELNSKAKAIVDLKFNYVYSSLFTQLEYAKPEPNRDIDFDDFADLDFYDYKDVNIHSIDIYDNGEYLNGLELYYIVDGDIAKYVLHHRVNAQPTQPKGGLQPQTTLNKYGGNKSTT